MKPKVSQSYSAHLEPFTHRMIVDGVEVQLEGFSRSGRGTPLVFLHGFGSTKEDYADVVHQPTLAGRPILAWDAPGCGASRVSQPSAVTVAFLVKTAEQILAARDLTRIHLAGHSMGGLTALRLATANPAAVESLISIEGNLAPEDCFLSRQIIQHATPDPAGFFDDLLERLRRSRFVGSALYAAACPAKAHPDIVKPIFESMVELSDSAPLLEDFITLPMARMFMYGQQNADLSYLPRLAASTVDIAEIPHCAHFPMYSNPPAMWQHISDFITRTSLAVK